MISDPREEGVFDKKIWYCSLKELDGLKNSASIDAAITNRNTVSFYSSLLQEHYY